MLLGPDAAVSCPSCGAKARYRTALSGNTFGASYWTDGKRVAPMLAELPNFVRCGSCSSCYWLRDEIRDDDDLIDDEGGEGAPLPYIEGADEADMHAALAAGQVAGGEAERELRILAWWISNDQFRVSNSLSVVEIGGLTGARRGNLRALLPLLNEYDDNDLIMRAEIHRELGDFAAALQQLEEIADERFDSVVRQLRELCENRETRVQQLRFG